MHHHSRARKWHQLQASGQKTAQIGADRGDHRNGRHLLKGNHGTIVIVIIVSHVSSGAVFWWSFNWKMANYQHLFPERRAY